MKSAYTVSESARFLAKTKDRATSQVRAQSWRWGQCTTTASKKRAKKLLFRTNNKKKFQRTKKNPPDIAVFLVVEPLNPLYTDLSGLLKGKAIFYVIKKGLKKIEICIFLHISIFFAGVIRDIQQKKFPRILQCFWWWSPLTPFILI